MKYLIGGVLLVFGLFTSFLAAYCVYLGFVGTPINFILAVPFFITSVVAYLAFSASVSALKDW